MFAWSVKSVFVHKVTCGSVCGWCLATNNRSSVPISRGRVPGDLAPPCDWLARQREKFTLEGAPRVLGFFSSPLPIKCGMRHAERPLGVCSNMCVCVCFHRLLLYLFFLTNFTQRSLTKNQAAARPVSQLGWDLLSFYLYLLSWPFKIKGGYKKINKSLFSVKNLMWEITHECLQPPFPRAPVDRRTPNVWVPERTSELCKPRNRSETAHISTCTLMWQRGNERIWT